MRRVFADSYYFVALLNLRDDGHRAAVEFTQGFSGEIWTTAWVLTEVANACARPPARSAFLSLLDDLERDPSIHIVAASEHEYRRGKVLFAQRADKEWSLTDCISFVVMEDYDLAEALTADRHFEQAGFTALLQ